MKTEYEKVLLLKSVQQELEKLRTQAIADAAEITRLQSGFDELRRWSRSIEDKDITDDWDRGYRASHRVLEGKINRITGVEK